MHLSAKQFLLLIFPFLLSYGAYIFSEEIVENAHHLFPSYEKYSIENLDTKVITYLEIEKNYKVFKDIQNKVELRKKEAAWVATYIFYKKQESIRALREKKITKKPFEYKLQAIFPDDKAAIINDSIVKEGFMIYDAKVVKILNSKVLIKTKKGLQWLFLFQ